jgi:hypothetical protein
MAAGDSDVVVAAAAAYYFYLEDECEKNNRFRQPRCFWIHGLIISRRVATVKSDFTRIHIFLVIILIVYFRHGGLVPGRGVPRAPVKLMKLPYSAVGPDSS